MLWHPAAFSHDCLHCSTLESFPGDESKYFSPALVSHATLDPTFNHERVTTCCVAAVLGTGGHIVEPGGYGRSSSGPVNLGTMPKPLILCCFLTRPQKLHKCPTALTALCYCQGCCGKKDIDIQGLHRAETIRAKSGLQNPNCVQVFMHTQILSRPVVSGQRTTSSCELCRSFLAELYTRY